MAHCTHLHARMLSAGLLPDDSSAFVQQCYAEMSDGEQHAYAQSGCRFPSLDDARVNYAGYPLSYDSAKSFLDSILADISSDPDRWPESLAIDYVPHAGFLSWDDYCETKVCGRDCRSPHCGWSSRHDRCVAVATYPRAFTSKRELRQGSCNAADDVCALIRCSDECVAECGWSSKFGGCRTGGRTGAHEKGKGDCSARRAHLGAASSPF